MHSLLWLFDTVIGLYITLLIISIVLSWLVAFNVVNTTNRFVYMVGDFLYRLTEPALGRIRKVVPSFGGIDLSPLILIIGLTFLRRLVPELLV